MTRWMDATPTVVRVRLAMSRMPQSATTLTPSDTQGFGITQWAGTRRSTSNALHGSPSNSSSARAFAGNLACRPAS